MRAVVHCLQDTFPKAIATSVEKEDEVDTGLCEMHEAQWAMEEARSACSSPKSARGIQAVQTPESREKFEQTQIAGRFQQAAHICCIALKANRPAEVQSLLLKGGQTAAPDGLPGDDEVLEEVSNSVYVARCNKRLADTQVPSPIVGPRRVSAVDPVECPELKRSRERLWQEGRPLLRLRLGNSRCSCESNHLSWLMCYMELKSSLPSCGWLS